MKDKRIGVVGLGRMGANMARRIEDFGYTVSQVIDRRIWPRLWRKKLEHPSLRR